VHQAEIVDQMLTDLLDTITQSNPKKWQRLQRENAELDELHGAIIIWLGKLSMKELLDPQAQLVHSAIGIANYLENMGDVMEANLVTAAKKAQKLQVVVSQETRQMLKPLHAKVVESFQDMLTSLKNGDAVKARNVVDSKTSVNRLANRATTHLISRLIADQPNRLATFRFETDIIEGLKRLHTLIRRIARIILATHGHTDVKVLQADVSDTVTGKKANLPPNT
jgi:phosphate:Na+ symporter